MKIVETQPGTSLFERFESLVPQLYGADSIRRRLPPDSINRDLLSSCLLATDGDKILGRAALYRNPDLVYEGHPAACLGNYECVDDGQVSGLLLHHARQLAQASGAAYLLGPMNGSTWDAYRFSLDHDAPPFLSEPYHHLYYNTQWTAAGFEPVAAFFSSVDRQLDSGSEAVLQREKELIGEGVRFREIDLSDFEGELRRLHAFNSLAFRTNFLYTPITEARFVEKYAGMRTIIDPRLVMLAEDPQGALLGYFFCFPDRLDASGTSFVIKTIARHPDRRWTGLGHVLGSRINAQARALGYTSAVHAFMYRKGTSTTISENFNGHAYKRYALYAVKC